MMTHYVGVFVSPQRSTGCSMTSHSGIEIKHFRSSDNNNDIIVNDFSSVKKTEFNFERKTLHSIIFTIEQVIYECAI